MQKLHKEMQTSSHLHYTFHIKNNIKMLIAELAFIIMLKDVTAFV